MRVIAAKKLPLKLEDHKFLVAQLRTLGLDLANSRLAALNLQPADILEMTLDGINNWVEAVDEAGGFGHLGV